MTNTNCIHQFHYILVKDMLAHVFNVLCMSSFFGHEIEPVLGLGGQALHLGLGLEDQILVNITD